MKRILLILLSLTLCTSAFAQQHPAAERGFKPELVYDYNGFDTVNLFNGNLLATVALGLTYPVGGGLNYSFALRYSGNIWEEEEICSPMTGNCRIRYFPQRDNGGMGWRLSFGRLYAGSSTTMTGSAASMWRYESPDGSEHLFYETLHDPKCSSSVTTNCDPVVAGTTYTRDGSFLRMKEPASNVRVIEFGNGERHRYGQYTNSTGAVLWRLEYIYNTFSALDANGIPTTNFVRFEYVLNAQGLDDWKITDSHGRTHWVRFQPNPGTGSTAVPLVDKVEMAAFNGATAVYDISYVTATIKRPCENATDPTVTATVAFLSSVTLPSTETWAFTYEQPTSVCSDTSGTMTSATLPTGGRIEWNYKRNTYSATTVDSIGVRERRTYDLFGAQASHIGYSTVTGSTTVTVHAKRASDNTWQPDWKTIHYYDATYGATFGLPYTTASRSGAVPNPDGSSNGRYLSTETFDCDPAAGTCSSVADRATYVRFHLDAVSNCGIDYPCWRDRNRRSYTTRTLYVSDGGKYADQDSSNYDGLGHYRLVRTGGNFGRADIKEMYSDFNTNTRNWNPSTWTGSTVGTYSLDASGNRLSGFTMLGASDPWVLNTFTLSYVSEDGVQSRVQTCFDPRNGFLHRKRTLRLSSAGANDLLAVYTPAADGHIASEEYFGGDKQTLSTASLCTMALPAHDQYSYRMDHTVSYGVIATSRYVSAAGTPMPYYSLRQEIDPSTGLVKRTYDTSDLPTDNTYDTSGRLTWTLPAYNTGVSRRGSKSWDYTKASGTTPARTYAREWMEGGAFDLTLSTFHYDGFGRLWKEQNNLPSGAVSTRETTYDHAGRVATQSEWMNLSSPTNKTTYTYDLYGRTIRIVPADGTAHETTISWTGDSSMTETTRVATTQDGAGNPIETLQTRTEMYDRQGRLWRVIERPDGPGTTGITTEYTYNWGNRLTRVCQNGTGTTCGQTRVFTYDRRGLLVSEQQPEKGLNGNGTVSYTYDARGHIVRKLEGTTYGTFDLTYAYDRAERLIDVRQTPDPAAPVTKILQEFTYDNGVGFGKGKLYQAKRHNHDRVTNAVVVTETYSYQGREGAVSRRFTCVGSTGCTATTDKKFTVLFTYNDLALLENVTYPDCTAPAGCASSDSNWSRTVSNAYGNARLTSVWQSGGITHGTITYHDNGTINTVSHSNGMKTVHGLDPSYIRRPASIVAQYGSNAPIWSSGVYQYDGRGNVKKAGSDYYLYDGVSRLKEGTVDYLGPFNNRKHRFAYDPYGNQTNKYTSENGGAEVDNNWYINAGNNRMSSPWPAQYDEAGNMTVWNNGSSTYSYDGLGMLQSSSTPTGTRLYFYTAEGERIWVQNTTSATGRWSIRDLAGRVLREYTTSGPINFEAFSFAKDYIYRDQSLLAAITPGGTFHFHLDHLGSVRLVTNSSGAEVSRHKFFPFGQEVSIYSTNPESRKFTSHERDYNGGTGGENVEYLDYMHARYYSPIWGRFLSPDRYLDVEANIGDPQRWNRYAYVLNNPVTNIDPDGEVAIAAGGVAVGGGLIIATGAVVWHTHQMNNNPEYRQAMIDLWHQTAVFMSKLTGNQRDTGLIGVSDEELARLIRTTSGQERLRYIKEEKARRLRNKQKRGGDDKKKKKDEPKKEDKKKEDQNASFMGGELSFFSSLLSSDEWDDWSIFDTDPLYDPSWLDEERAMICPQGFGCPI